MPERTSWLAAAITSRAGRGCGTCAVLLQAPQDVLDVDHRIVDQLADGDGEAAERHRVDGQAQGLEDQTVIRIEIGMAVSEMKVARAFIRNTNHHRDDDGGLEQRALDVADRSLDEGRLPELDVGDVDPGGSVVCMSSSAASILRVSATVSAAGCFWTLTMTAGLPL